MVVPLSTLLALLTAAAPPASACQYGPPGHVHVFATPPPSFTAPPVEIGRCGGQGAVRAVPPPPDPSSPPLSLKASGIDAPSLTALTRAGFRADPGADRLYEPGSPRPITQREFERLWGPLDAANEGVFYEVWMQLQLQGYRLDEKSCELVHPERGPLRRVDIQVIDSDAAKGRNHAALESLLAELRGLPPDQPVPDRIIEKMRMMDKTGLRLQADVRALLFARNPPTIKSLGASADSAYRASTLYFDGARDMGSFVSAAGPAGPAAPPRIPIADEETRLGRLFAKEFEAAFTRVGPGRDLLAGFRGRDGAVHLPPILCLKLTQKPGEADIGALNDPGTRQVVINHWEIAKWTVGFAPKPDQARLAASFSNPAELRRYLEANPEVRRKVVDLLDSSVFHELVHYRQNDESKVSIEAMRGNLPSTTPLSFEKEAHRRTCLYALARQVQDPSLALFNYGSTGASDCQKLMADADAFDARVADTYRRSYSWFGDLPDIAERQQVRKKTSSEIAWSLWTGVRDRAAEALKLRGLPNGDAALAAEGARIRRERDEFDRELAPIREEWLRIVPPKLLADGRPDAALTAYEAAGLAGHEDLARAAAAATADLLRRRAFKGTGMERVAAFQTYQRFAAGFGLGVDVPLLKAYVADARRMISDVKKTPVPGMDTAAWEKSLSDVEKSIRDAEAASRGRPGGRR